MAKRRHLSYKSDLVCTLHTFSPDSNILRRVVCQPHQFFTTWTYTMIQYKHILSKETSANWTSSRQKEREREKKMHFKTERSVRNRFLSCMKIGFLNRYWSPIMKMPTNFRPCRRFDPTLNEKKTKTNSTNSTSFLITYHIMIYSFNLLPWNKLKKSFFSIRFVMKWMLNFLLREQRFMSFTQSPAIARTNEKFFWFSANILKIPCFNINGYIQWEKSCCVNLIWIYCLVRAFLVQWYVSLSCTIYQI